MNLKYTPGVVVKYHGPTDFRGSRVSLDLYDRGLPRKWIPYDYAVNGVAQMGANALETAGFNVLGYTDQKDANVVLITWDGIELAEKWAKVGK